MLKSVISGTILLLISAGPSFALCTSYPNTLTNGTTADGGQVMANFNCAALTSGSTINGLTLTGTTTFPGSGQISSAGLLGIGMTPSNILDVTQNQNAGAVVGIHNSDAGTAANAEFNAYNGTDFAQYGVIGTGYTTNGILSAHRTFVISSSGLSAFSGTDIRFAVNGSTTEIARFGTDSSFLVGTTTNGGWTGSANVEFRGSTSRYPLSLYQSGTGTFAEIIRVDNTSDGLIDFRYGGTQIGTILTNGTSTSYNTTSDERLKNWAIPQRDYRSAIHGLWVGDFTWKSNGHADFGIRAQQVYPLFPAAIRKPDTAAGQWQADYGKLAPLALWGVKDLYKTSDNQNARISALEHEISALHQVNDADQAEIRQLKAQISAASDNQAQINRLLTQVTELRQRVGIRAASN